MHVRHNFIENNEFNNNIDNEIQNMIQYQNVQICHIFIDENMNFVDNFVDDYNDDLNVHY